MRQLAGLIALFMVAGCSSEPAGPQGGDGGQSNQGGEASAGQGDGGGSSQQARCSAVAANYIMRCVDIKVGASYPFCTSIAACAKELRADIGDACFVCAVNTGAYNCQESNRAVNCTCCDP
jgi:hypothetical protein